MLIYYIQTLIKEGAQDYITKPSLNGQLLEKTIEYAIERKKRDIELNNYKNHLEELVKERTEELELAIATKNKFFSIIAHDLRNPFAGLLGSCRLLNDSIVKKDIMKIKMFSNSIQSSAEDAYKLLENLLSWSRLQTGKLEAQKVEFNIHAAIKDAITTVHDIATEKEIEIIILGDDKADTLFDVEMFKAIIRNLTTNAIKFSQKHKKVIVEIATTNEDKYKILVKDSGIGMSKEDITQLFKVGVTYTNKGTSGEKGTGLGLILCKEFAEKNGSQITVESEVGKGSTFGFTVKKFD